MRGSRTGAGTLAAVTMVAGLLGACGDDVPVAVIDPGDGGEYAPSIDRADFVEGIDNDWLPFEPGRRWVYESVEGEDIERIEVTVTDERKTVMGVPVVVVRDTVIVDGELVEDTFDWYAQDTAGNVWYMGEDSTEFEDGEPVTTAGSWEAGVDGALPGVIMWADPRVGQAYRQEYYEGEAVDMAEVARTDQTANLRIADFDGVLVIREWTPLEPEVIEEKHYAKGVGVILEVKVAGEEGRVELIEAEPEP